MWPARIGVPPERSHQILIAQIARLSRDGPLGGGGSFIFMTAEGFAALQEFGRRWRKENSERQRLIGENKAEELAVLAHGELLKRANENYYPEDTGLKVAFKELLSERLAAMQVALAHYLPCQIFDQSNLAQRDEREQTADDVSKADR
jgi:hypothetical protein